MKKPNNHHRETWMRSLVKTLTYRVLILILDFTVVYFLSGKIEVALGFMIVSNIYTSVGYYFHERVWNSIKWGKLKSGT